MYIQINTNTLYVSRKKHVKEQSDEKRSCTLNLLCYDIMASKCIKFNFDWMVSDMLQCIRQSQGK